MKSIFINYRREDSAGWVVGLSKSLMDAFGQDNVFVDIDALEIGLDYAKQIDNVLDGCDIVLAVIGPHWLNVKDKTGGRKIDSEHDFVRAEIVKSLRRPIRVIPVLVGGAVIPLPEEVPEELRELLRRQSYEISDTRWRYDVDQLIAHLKRIFVRNEGVSCGVKPECIVQDKTDFSVSVRWIAVAVIVAMSVIALGVL